MFDEQFDGAHCHHRVRDASPRVCQTGHTARCKTHIDVHTQKTRTRDFTCSVSEFTSSTGSIHVISPDSVNKFDVSTRVYREITSFSRDDTYQ